MDAPGRLRESREHSQRWHLDDRNEWEADLRGQRRNSLFSPWLFLTKWVRKYLFHMKSCFLIVIQIQGKIFVYHRNNTPIIYFWVYWSLFAWYWIIPIWFWKIKPLQIEIHQNSNRKVLAKWKHLSQVFWNLER